MATEDTKILSIKVDYKEAIKGIVDYKQKIQDVKAAEAALRDELKEMEKSVKEGSATQKEYNDKLQAYNEEVAANKIVTKEYSDAVRALEKEVRNNIHAQDEQEGSLKSLRAELSNLTSEYDSLSRAEREGAKGRELFDKINQVTDELKEAEEATQRYYRNVGNYENAIKDAFSELKKQLQDATEEYERLVEVEGEHAEVTKRAKKNMDDLQLTLDFTEEASSDLNSSVLGFVTAGNPWAMAAMNMVQQGAKVKDVMLAGAKSVGVLAKQLWALVKIPIVALLSAIVVVISAVSKGITASEENTNRWRQAMAPLSAALDAFTNLLTKFAAMILTGVEYGMKFLLWINKALEAIPLLGEAFKAQNEAIEKRSELMKMQIANEKAARQEIEDSAKRENEIAKLRAQVTDKENLTAKERKAALEEAIRLEEQDAAIKKKLAEDNLKALELEGSLTENDAEMNNKLAEARAAVTRADTEYFNKIRELNAQRAELSNQIAAEEKAAADAEKARLKELAEAWKEAKEKEMEYIRQAEDAMLALVKDGREKQAQLINLQYDREIEELEKKLATEKNLTAKAREAINIIIIAKENERQHELAKLAEEELQREIKERAELLKVKLEAVEADSDAEMELKRALLDTQLEMELSNTELSEEMKAAIREKYRVQREEMEEAHAEKLKEIADKALQDKIAGIEKEQEEALLRYEDAGASEYQLRAQQAYDKLELARQTAQTQEEIDRAEADYQQEMFGMMSESIAAMGEENEAFAKLSKVLALGELAVNTGKALSAGIAQAQSVPFPGNIAAIATTVATILANIATAKKTIQSAKFSTGGLVEGEGSGTSDSVPAMLSNGESVMTATATQMFAPLLSSLNQMGGGVPITVMGQGNNLGEDMLAAAVAKGMQYAPRPVVSVEEINSVNHRVEVLEKLGTL